MTFLPNSSRLLQMHSLLFRKVCCACRKKFMEKIAVCMPSRTLGVRPTFVCLISRFPCGMLMSKIFLLIFFNLHDEHCQKSREFSQLCAEVDLLA